MAEAQENKRFSKSKKKIVKRKSIFDESTPIKMLPVYQDEPPRFLRF